MGIVRTDEWVKELLRDYEEKRSQDLYEGQLNKIGVPVSHHFPSSSPEEVTYHLQQHGLFQPGEWRKMKRLVGDMKDRGIWETIEHEFVQLKDQWKGPDIPVYIFPITRGYEKRQVKNKNGLAIKGAVFLFLTASHKQQELRAILAHEYHHVCRMIAQGLSEETLRLEDLLVLEGTAEQAVKRIYGKEWLAPWTSVYKEKECKSYWGKYILPLLESTDHEQNMKLMYGKKHGRPPKWVGYNAAYHLVNAYCRTKGLHDLSDLFQVSAEEVIKESSFVKSQL